MKEVEGIKEVKEFSQVGVLGSKIFKIRLWRPIVAFITPREIPRGRAKLEGFQRQRQRRTRLTSLEAMTNNLDEVPDSPLSLCASIASADRDAKPKITL